jgi:hypothetical protein
MVTSKWLLRILDKKIYVTSGHYMGGVVFLANKYSIRGGSLLETYELPSPL